MKFLYLDFFHSFPAACPSMMNLSLSINSIFGRCAIDDDFCYNMRCTQESASPFQMFILTFFFCNEPPAVRVFLADADLRAQIDVIVNKTTNGIPFRNSSLGTMNIRMEVDRLKTSIGFGVNPEAYSALFVLYIFFIL